MQPKVEYKSLSKSTTTTTTTTTATTTPDTRQSTSPTLLLKNNRHNNNNNQNQNQQLQSPNRTHPICPFSPLDISNNNNNINSNSNNNSCSSSSLSPSISRSPTTSDNSYNNNSNNNNNNNKRKKRLLQSDYPNEQLEVENRIQQQLYLQHLSQYSKSIDFDSAKVGSNAPIPTIDHDHHCLSTIASKAPRPSYRIHSPKSYKVAPTTFIPISPNSGKQLAQPHASPSSIHNNKSIVSSDGFSNDQYNILNDSNNNNNSTTSNICSREEILLPIDVLDLIFSQLSFPDRCTCAWVCSTWRCTLMMTPNPLLENCMISLHQPPPLRKLPPIRHIINKLNITIAPCSCNFCYFHNDPYQYLKRWIDYLEPACFSSDLSKVTLRVFHNSSPELPPPPPAHGSMSTGSPLSPVTCTSTDPANAGLNPQLQHECSVNHGFSRDYNQQRSHFFDLEKPLALPFHDIGAVIPLSILSSLLNSKIKELKVRVCIDLPYSKKKEDDYFNKIVKVENLTEIGLLTHDPADTSFSAACKTSHTILDKVFSTLFVSPITFINLRRLYLVTTTIDKNVFNNFNNHLPSLEGLHLSVWNHDLVKLFEDITSIFGTKLKELGIRFTTCTGIKYSTSFSHRDRKLEDSMVELLTSRCPNLNYFSFEGWLSNLSDASLKHFGKLNFKHFVLKNGLDSRICRPIWARLKLDLDNIGCDMISEKELKRFTMSQTNLKVFEITASEIDKFISATPIAIDPHSPSINTSSIMYRSMLSDDFVNNVLDKCLKIQYLKIVDNTNYRTYLRGNRSKVSQQPYQFQYGSPYNTSHNDSNNNNNSDHVHQPSMSHFHFHPNQTVDKRELLNLFQIN